MLDIKTKVYNYLVNDTVLVALLGSSDRIVSAWGETIETFPCLIYQDDDQSDSFYADNVPNGVNAKVRIDIFTKTDLASTTEIGIEVSRIMTENFFNCGSNGEVFDDTVGVKHRVMRFSRELLSTD